MRRPIRWELITCALRDHVLVGTDAATLRPQDAPVARELGGLRWHRCLRCDTWTPLPPPRDPAREHHPGSEEIEIPERGKALRDKVVLRLIAIDRIVHFLLLGILGVAILAFAAHESSLRGTFYRVLADIQRGVAGGPVQSTAHHGILHELQKLFSLQSGTLTRVGIVMLAYAVLEGVEAVGLWLAKRWAEYLTFLATTVLLPLEVYELLNRATVLKALGFAFNLAIVIWLLFKKRLFGLRGGGRVDEEQRAADMSWEAILSTAPPYTEPEPVGR